MTKKILSLYCLAMIAIAGHAQQKKFPETSVVFGLNQPLIAWVQLRA